MSFSRSGSHYASAAKLFNCLIACLLMSTIAFAALPYFLVQKPRSTSAAKPRNLKAYQAKFLAVKRNGNPGIVYGAKPSLHKVAGATRDVVRTRYGKAAKFQVLKGKTVKASPKGLDVRGEKNEKVQTR